MRRTAALSASTAPEAEDLSPIPPATGPHIGPPPADFADAKSFHAADRIVGADFRLAIAAPEFAVGGVTLSR